MKWSSTLIDLIMTPLSHRWPLLNPSTPKQQDVSMVSILIDIIALSYTE